jgi:hypothetical protein
MPTGRNGQLSALILMLMVLTSAYLMVVLL